MASVRPRPVELTAKYSDKIVATEALIGEFVTPLKDGRAALVRLIEQHVPDAEKEKAHKLVQGVLAMQDILSSLHSWKNCLHGEKEMLSAVSFAMGRQVRARCGMHDDQIWAMPNSLRDAYAMMGLEEEESK
jgi:hypothetical protein